MVTLQNREQTYPGKWIITDFQFGCEVSVEVLAGGVRKAVLPGGSTTQAPIRHDEILAKSNRLEGRRSAKGGLHAAFHNGIFHVVPESIRADKWLWATRFSKTRALAGEILGDGKVKRNGHTLKRSSSIQPGDVLEVPFAEGPGVREIHVKAVIEKRVGAPEAQACYEDLTKAEVYEALKAWQIARSEAASGRPTKKDRRAIDRIREDWEWGI